MKRKQRVIGEEIVKKYFNALNELRGLIELGEPISMADFERELSLSNRTSKSLQSLNVIKVVDGAGRNTRTYSWNDKIPVTAILAKKVIDQNRVYNKNYKSIIQKRTNKIQKDAIKISTPNQYQAPKRVNDVGLIRRFFRWIY